MTEKRAGGADDKDTDQQRPRVDVVEVDWFKTAPLQSKPDGFHFGHLVYNLKGMEADAIKSGLINANVAGEVNLFALVVRKVTGNDKRISEVKKFLPGAIVNFEGRSVEAFLKKIPRPIYSFYLVLPRRVGVIVVFALV